MCQIGHKLSEETKKKISLAFTGENHWNWQGGISKSLEHQRNYRRKRRHQLGISKKYISKYGGELLYQKYGGELTPWAKTYKRIITRCYYDKNSSYYKRGIKCLITIRELEILWLRDKASKLKQPSIDRINNKDNYTFDNCRYIELTKNRKTKVR